MRAVNPTVEEPYRSFNAFWTPAEKNFLARERQSGHAADRGEDVDLPSVRVATPAALELGIARVREAMVKFRSVMRATTRAVPREEFREVQKFYYSLLRLAQALGRGAYELTGDADLARGWIGALMRTPEFKAFGRISDRFRQQTPTYRKKKRAYDAVRNADPDVRALRTTAEAKERINHNARIRYHLRRLRDLVARTRRQVDRGGDELALRAAQVEVARLYTRIDELRRPAASEIERRATCTNAVDEFFSDLRRVA
jgi:hypothetical protein